MPKNKIGYTELSKAEVSKNRNVVISVCSKGGFTVAQQIVVDEEGHQTAVFLKGAIHVDGISNLYGLRDALNLAIQLVEATAEVEPDAWDETT